MKRELEFHDSDLLSIVTEDGRTEVEMEGYVHQWEQDSTGWRGTGWTQRVLFRFQQSQVLHQVEALPVGLSAGSLSVTGLHYGMVPIPFENQGPSSLRMETVQGQTAIVSGQSVKVSPDGAAVFVEVLPEGFRPEWAV